MEEWEGRREGGREGGREIGVGEFLMLSRLSGLNQREVEPDGGVGGEAVVEGLR